MHLHHGWIILCPADDFMMSPAFSTGIAWHGINLLGDSSNLFLGMSLQPNQKQISPEEFPRLHQNHQPMDIISHLKSPAAPDSPDSLFCPSSTMAKVPPARCNLEDLGWMISLEAFFGSPCFFWGEVKGLKTFPRNMPYDKNVKWLGGVLHGP